MEVIRTTRAGRSDLKLKGRMDSVWSDHVANALTECVRAGDHVIALDMTEVDYISSAGIRILMLHSRQLKAIQGRLILTRVSNAVASVLKLVGLSSLLPAAAESAAAETLGDRPSQQLTFSPAGATAQVYPLEPAAPLRVQWAGNPQPWLNGSALAKDCQKIEFPADTIGLGLGALGSKSEDGGGLGEFLAAGGVVVCQPADGSNQPDYMLHQGALTPAVNVAYGIHAQGGFSRLVRFDKGPEESSLPLSAVVKACLAAVNSNAAGMVILAETASLVGASLQKSPDTGGTESGPRNIFRYPEVRDWLSFTAEAGYANSVSLIVGFAAQDSGAANLRLLKPLLRSGELHGHFHAAAFPYHPLRKGKVSLAEAIHPLFETENVLGVLHLLNDWRDAHGSGESALLRGACWCAPLVT
ncbi:MAG TPA: STAS domain-containing protein [Verrucomicrobiae bacterium]